MTWNCGDCNLVFIIRRFICKNMMMGSGEVPSMNRSSHYLNIARRQPARFFSRV